MTKVPGAFSIAPPNKPDHSDVHSALNAVSSGIHAGLFPVQFKDAIEISQDGLGNRATMAFVRQQYQHNSLCCPARIPGKPGPVFNDRYLPG